MPVTSAKLENFVSHFCLRCPVVLRAERCHSTLSGAIALYLYPGLWGPRLSGRGLQCLNNGYTWRSRHGISAKVWRTPYHILVVIMRYCCDNRFHSKGEGLNARRATSSE